MAEDVGAALVALDGEVRKLLDMLRRDGRLWEHAAEPLPCGWPQKRAAEHLGINHGDHHD